MYLGQIQQQVVNNMINNQTSQLYPSGQQLYQHGWNSPLIYSIPFPNLFNEHEPKQNICIQV